MTQEVNNTKQEFQEKLNKLKVSNELMKEEKKLSLPTGFYQNLYLEVEKYTENDFELAKGYNLAKGIQSATNALRQVKDWDKAYPDSIKNAVMNQITAGHYVELKHGYYINYGGEITYMPSYMGNILTMKRDFGAKDAHAMLVYDKDIIETEVINGQDVITKHTRGYSPFAKEIGNLNYVIGCYAVVTFNDGRTPIYELMTKDQINSAWSMAQTKKVQDKFPDQMIKRTVLNRIAKKIMSSDVDSKTRLGRIAQVYYDADKYDFEDKDIIDVPLSANTIEISASDDDVVEEQGMVLEIVNDEEDITFPTNFPTNENETLNVDEKTGEVFEEEQQSLFEEQQKQKRPF